MPVKKQTQKQSQIVQVIIGAEVLDKITKKKRKPKKKKVKRKVKPIEEDLREPYRRNRYMKPLKYKQTFPAYGGNNMIMQQTENQRNNRILSDLTQRVNQYERLLKQKPNPINKFIIREAQEIKEEDIPEEVEEETERLEEELEQEELMRIEQEIEEQERIKMELEEEDERRMMEEEIRMIEKEDEEAKEAERKAFEQAQKIAEEMQKRPKGRVKKRVEEIEEGIPEAPTPPNEPGDLEPGSFGGRPGPLEPVQAVPVPVGEGANIPEVGIPEDFPPPPRTTAEESKAAEEADIVEFIDIPKPTQFNARYNLLDEVEKAQFMKKFPRFFRSDKQGNLFLRADGSIKAQTITISDIDKDRFKLTEKKLTYSGDKIDEAKKFLLDKLTAKNKALERQAIKKGKSVVV